MYVCNVLNCGCLLSAFVLVKGGLWVTQRLPSVWSERQWRNQATVLRFSVLLRNQYLMGFQCQHTVCPLNGSMWSIIMWKQLFSFSFKLYVVCFSPLTKEKFIVNTLTNYFSIITKYYHSSGIIAWMFQANMVKLL